MIRALAGTDVVLAVAVVVLTLLIIAVRAVALRRNRWESRLRPATEVALAGYLAGVGAGPAPTGRAEREVLLTVALEAMSDLRGSERARLVELLERLGYAGEAGTGLGARSRVVRQRAAETLAAMATPTAASALAAGLSDRDVLVRTTAARGLAEAGGEDVLPAVTATACRDVQADHGGAAAIVLALGMHRQDALAPLLRPQAPAEIRDIAVTLAGELRLAQYTPALLACLIETDELATSAAHGLGRIGDVAAVGALSRLAADSRRPVTVRAAALRALGAVGDPSACRLLEQQFQGSQWPLLDACAGALARLGEPGAAALRRAAGSGRPDVAALAQAALQS